jgi:hypothetical protein
MREADLEYAEVAEAPVHNSYFSVIIVFVCALISFEEKDLHHLM